MFDFELGNYVVDGATCFKGVIDGRAIWNTGNIQYSLKPKVKDDGTMQDSMWIDGDHLRTSNKNLGVDSNYGDPAFKFDNGDEVKSTIFKFKGIVVGKIQWLNGCLEYSICSQKLDSEQKGIYKTISEEELELVKSKAVKTKKRIKGGPIKSSMNTRAQRSA